ncbi:RNA-binding protein LSM5 SCDLUD_001621 [Saccharomycodes ludwigii]|uniref:RNA-binding protein LSM5 n=1 Tax=Saccharomycodes ludwigii TaxID=36035 RepID=UPI001E8C82A4|nr:hypothetical protein SCDLUD_001621 [Saccharomycodes ludwigii]KAH3901838.1 hypothetical protein SCDLUD_001621 [Saccharomycodes ludwigii]
MSEETNTNPATELLPFEVIDKTINQQIWIITDSKREYTGKLVGFDDFVNVILKDCVEYYNNEKINEFIDGKETLINGQNITLLVPGERQEMY